MTTTAGNTTLTAMAEFFKTKSNVSKFKLQFRIFKSSTKPQIDNHVLIKRNGRGNVLQYKIIFKHA